MQRVALTFICRRACALSEEQQKRLASGQDVDFAIQTPDGCRQRVNVFRQQKKLAATIRLLNDRIPSLGELKLPNILQELASQPRGLILVTGPTGSGKSTTLAAMVEYINERRADHIVTIEDPIEYVFTRKKALVHQREVGEDTDSFAAALRFRRFIPPGRPRPSTGLWTPARPKPRTKCRSSWPGS